MSIASPQSYTNMARDALTHVAGFLDPRDLAQLSQVDKRSRGVAQKAFQKQLISTYLTTESHCSDWCHRLRKLFLDKRFQCLSFVQREEVLAGVEDDEFSLLCFRSELGSTLTLHDIYKKLGASTRFRPLIEKILSKDKKGYGHFLMRYEWFNKPLENMYKLYLWGIERLDFEHERDEGWFGYELSLADATKIVEMIRQGWGGTKRIEIRGCRVNPEVFTKLQEAGVEVSAAPVISKQEKWVLAVITLILSLGCLAAFFSLTFLVRSPDGRPDSTLFCFAAGFTMGTSCAFPILLFTPRCITWIRDKCFTTPLHHIPPHPRLNELSIPDSSFRLWF